MLRLYTTRLLVLLYVYKQNIGIFCEVPGTLWLGHVRQWHLFLLTNTYAYLLSGVSSYYAESTQSTVKRTIHAWSTVIKLSFTSEHINHLLVST